MSNQIITENQNTGTTNWQISHISSTQIQGYASAKSVDPGGSLTIYVSTQVASTTYTIDVYRLGWYQGNGGRLMQSATGLVGQAQGYWDASGQTLNNCPTAFTDATTGLLEARFASSYTLNIPSNWCTGVYLLKFTDANNWQSYAHFVVRCKGTEDYVAVRADLTDAAYNAWGGKSLYTSNSVGGVSAQKVSLDRPSTNVYGGDYLIRNDICLIKWMEQMGYDVGYLSDIDVHATSGILNGHKAYISMGHDEYWTKEERNAVEAAIALGIGAAFTGANSCFWQVRMESGGQNGANRTVVCYKSLSDPQVGVDNTRVTVNWRSWPVNYPEASMIGIMFDKITNGSNFAWAVDANANSPYLTGTGLVPGQSYGSDLVGNECDRAQAYGPNNVQIIGTSAYTNDIATTSYSNTTTYIAPSGALVFAVGSISWTWALDTYRTGVPVGSVAVIHGMQQLMAHIMTALIRPKQPTGFSAFSAHR